MSVKNRKKIIDRAHPYQALIAECDHVVERLARMRSNERVEVDASAVCANLHCRKLAQLEHSAWFRHLKGRMFSVEKCESAVCFGGRVELTKAEILSVFGEFSDVPYGAVRFKHAVSMASYKLDKCAKSV